VIARDLQRFPRDPPSCRHSQRSPEIPQDPQKSEELALEHLRGVGKTYSYYIRLYTYTFQSLQIPGNTISYRERERKREIVTVFDFNSVREFMNK
jgi:hypothetical protein